LFMLYVGVLKEEKHKENQTNKKKNKTMCREHGNKHTIKKYLNYCKE